MGYFRGIFGAFTGAKVRQVPFEGPDEATKCTKPLWGDFMVFPVVLVIITHTLGVEALLNRILRMKKCFRRKRFLNGQDDPPEKKIGFLWMKMRQTLHNCLKLSWRARVHFLDRSETMAVVSLY